MSGRAELRGGPVVRGLNPAAEARAEAGDAYRVVLDPLESHPGAASADRVWAFPPRDVRGVPAALIVVSAYADTDERRRLLTARLVVDAPEDASRRRPPASRVEVAEQGEVPRDRVPRLLDGVVRRLGEDPVDGSPASFDIGGDPERWAEMRATLAAERIQEPELSALPTDQPSEILP